MQSHDLIEASLRDFNARKVRIRLSVTYLCNLNCTFCHEEGMIGTIHNKKNQTAYRTRFMSMDTFQSLIDTYVQLSGHEINLTGGEPFLNPKIKEMLTYCRNYPEVFLTVSTNGLLLHKMDLNPKDHPIGETKISLHTRNQALAENLLGKSYDVDKVLENIIEHKKKGYRVIANLTLTKDNFNELEEIIRWAIQYEVNIKINDLGRTDLNSEYYETMFETFDQVISLVESIVGHSFDKKLDKRSGNYLLKYDLPTGNHILIKDIRQGRFHTKMCDGCAKINTCSEGVFALRVDPSGTYSPCLLRKDFDTMRSEFSGCVNEKTRMKIAVHRLMTGDIRPAGDWMV